VSVKGPKGELQAAPPMRFVVSQDNALSRLRPPTAAVRPATPWLYSRPFGANIFCFEGVSKGFLSRKLETFGVGYRPQIQGRS